MNLCARLCDARFCGARFFARFVAARVCAQWRYLAAASLAAALAGCGGNDGGTVPTPTVAPDVIDFEIFTNQAFSNSANSTPVSLDVTFNFDTNEEPYVFDQLIAAGSFGGP
jgi:hypothetical protein